MKKILLALPLALAACAPASQSSTLKAKAEPGEVIVRVESSAYGKSVLSDEMVASSRLLAKVTGIMVEEKNTFLPTAYAGFTIDNDQSGPGLLSKVGESTTWHYTAKNQAGQVVSAEWFFKALGDKMLSTRVKVSSTDAAVNTRAVEDALYKSLLASSSIKVVADSR